MSETTLKDHARDDLNTERLLCLALDVGEGMLKSGGEINRVENTIERICRAYGAAHIEVFVIPSVIIAALRGADGSYSSQVRRIVSIENHLLRLEQFNEISRRICRLTPPLDEVDILIRNAKAKRSYPVWVRNLAGAVAAGSFALFFGGYWKDGLSAALIGSLIGLVDLLPVRQVNRLAKTLIQSFMGGILAWLAVLVGFGSDVGMIMIGTIMLLIPGLSFGTALRDLLCGDLLAGSLKTVQACLAALMIAAGYLLSLVVMGGVA
jgi:uncharacterized membrane protein YjjP (DUF1212 family)